jgi:hypothetical protein
MTLNPSTLLARDSFMRMSNSRERRAKSARSRSRGAFRVRADASIALEIERAQGRPGAGRTHGPPANKKQAAVTTGSANHPAFPARWFNGVLRALVSAKSARMGERAVLANRPSLDLSPIVLEGHKSLSGSVGQTRCLPQPEQLHGL